MKLSQKLLSGVSMLFIRLRLQSLTALLSSQGNFIFLCLRRMHTGQWKWFSGVSRTNFPYLSRTV